MSSQYDSYLEQHKANVKKGFEWIREHIPDILQGDFDYEWQICLNHDHSKTEPDEYEAYDAYFYGGNRSFDVVQNFNKAWLLHIHRNPHHWQHWVLINDEPNEGEIIIQMPINYIVEMICDWWAFSWNKGDLTEMFSWYEERKNYIKMHKNTRKTVEDIFAKIKEALNNDLSHHGIKGQKWGVRNGPPYPIDKSQNNAKIKDVYIGRSVGAKSLNYDVLDPDSGEYFNFSEGTRIRDAHVFAGKGGAKPLKPEVAEGLSEQYGGEPDKWQHCKGIGTINYHGEDIDAEVHWFQEESAGKHKFKIKKWED